MGPAIVERAFGGFDDMRWRREVGLTNFKVHNAAALGFERACFDQDIESRFDFEAVHAIS